MIEIFVTKSFAKDDGSGCELIYNIYTHEKIDVAVNIKLKIATERTIRNIGYVSIRENTYHTYRERDKHLHNMSASYGFNHEIFKDKTFFTIDKIHLYEKGIGHYLIPVHILERFGSFLHFKQSGFEMQRFLRLDIIENFKVNDFKSEIVNTAY